jgi:tubulin-folding cofactor B
MADINVYVTSDLTSSERRISPQWTLSYLKSRLELITGIPPKYQKIQYYSIPNSNECQTLCSSENQGQDSMTVNDLNIIGYSRLHVIDENPDSELQNLKDEEDEVVEQVAFKLSEEEYSKRSDSALQWKRNSNLGRFDPQFNQVKQQHVAENESSAQNMKVGNRCRVINIEGERRGVIRYVGKMDILDNGEMNWIGVEFDEPVGKNDGSINGNRFFHARNKHGSFLKPKQVEVGDFPELDPFENSEDEEL